MGRPRKSVPRYLEHKQSGRGRCVWTDAAGVYHDVLLPGAFNSAASTTAYGKMILELAVAPQAARVKKTDGLTVVELLAAYLDHANRHYLGPDGKHTSELREHKLVIKAVRETYGTTPAAEFDALALRAVREGWVVAGLSRGEVNRRAGIVKRIFKWAVSWKLVPPDVLESLRSVTGLQRGRTAARDNDPVGPVDDATVDATLPHLNRFVRGLVEFQRLTGCRPGEACVVRRCDIDTGGAVWLYKPERHKNKFRGKPRVVAVGPKAQELLKEFFTADIEDYLFSPAKAVEELHAARTEERKTPKYDSHMKRNKAKRVKLPKRPPRDHYANESYNHAVARACEKAGVEPWKPNQLRHGFATRVRKAHGLEAAQVLLGHAKADVTQIYAERNEELAKSIAARIG